MWSNTECPKYKRVWITVNGVVHPAMYDGKVWRTPNGEYNAVMAWMPLVAPDPFLPPISYSDDKLVAMVKAIGASPVSVLRIRLLIPAASYNKLYKQLNRLVRNGRLTKKDGLYANIP